MFFKFKLKEPSINYKKDYVRCLKKPNYEWLHGKYINDFVLLQKCIHFSKNLLQFFKKTGSVCECIG